LIYTARILALGAIVRSNQLTSDFDDRAILNYILAEMSEVAGKKLVYLELAAPFICHVFRFFNETDVQKLEFACVQDLIQNQKEISLSLLQITLSLTDKNIHVPLLDDITSVIKTILVRFLI